MKSKDSNSSKTKWWTFEFNRGPKGRRIASAIWSTALLLFLTALLLRIAGCGREVEDQLGNIDWDWQNDGFWEQPINPGRPIDDDDIWVSPDDPLRRTIVRGRLNIYFEEHVDLRQAAKELENTFPDQFVRVASYASEYQRLTVDFKDASQADLISRIRSQPNVEFVFEEAIFTTSAFDPMLDDAGFWWARTLELSDCWRIEEGKPFLRLATLDNYFDPNHIELKDNVEMVWNTDNYSTRLQLFPVDGFAHGTHVAGLMVSKKDNGAGGCGVAPNCESLLVQLGDQSGRMLSSRIIDGMFFAKKNQARVINLSLGSHISPVIAMLPETEQARLVETTAREEEEMWDELFQLFASEGVIVVQAAGNSSSLAGLDPMKRSEFSIVVGATNRQGDVATFSNFGPDIDVYAPGEEIMSSTPFGNWGIMSGTSQASPIVAGAIGLMLSIQPDLTYGEVKRLLSDHASTIHRGQAGRFLQILPILNELNNQPT